ncbi:MAG: hypothetical protein ACTHJ8_09110 [Mucilaginibacter sp.]|jgi:hypothetical protein
MKNKAKKEPVKKASNDPVKEAMGHPDGPSLEEMLNGEEEKNVRPNRGKNRTPDPTPPPII